jgi:phosphatidylglycerophosphatase A
MNFPRLIAGGFGLGRLPGAPGTWASAAALIAGAGLLDISPWLLALAAAAASAGGVWAIAAARAGEDDPGWVVIDEVAGQWITMLALPRAAPLGLILALLLFRLLDVAKPGPIGWADRHAGALAVMGDDVIAGSVGALLLLALRAAMPSLLD